MDEIKILDNSKDHIQEVLGISDDMDKDVCVNLSRFIFLSAIKGETKLDALTKYLKSDEFKKINYPIDTANGCFVMGMLFIKCMRLVSKLENEIEQVAKSGKIDSLGGLMDALLKKGKEEVAAQKPVEEPKKGVDFIKFVEDSFGPISGEKKLETQKTVN